MADNDSSVWCSSVMLKPKLIRPIPPKVSAFASHSLSHPAQNVSVADTIHGLTLWKELLVDDSS